MRRTFAYSGTAVAVGVAVVCSLAVSNAVALTDVAAVPVSAAPVVVPSGKNPGAAQAPITVDERAERRAGHAVAQTVPAPQPRTVKAKPSQPQTDAAPAAPETKPPPKRGKDAAHEHKKHWWGTDHDRWRDNRHDDKDSAEAGKTSALADGYSGHDLPREWTGSERKKSRSSSPADHD